MILLLFAESQVTNWEEVIANGGFEVLGATVGGLIAFWIARKSIKSALQNDQEKSAINAKIAERSLLLSIHAELQGLFRIYRLEVEGLSLDSLADGQGFYYYLPLSQNYFSVFESNAIHIGIIENSELRQQIIDTYLNAKALVGCHLYNNKLLDVRDRYWEKVLENPNNEQIQKLLDGAIADVDDYGSTVREMYLAAIASYEQAISNLDKEIDG